MGISYPSSHPVFKVEFAGKGFGLALSLLLSFSLLNAVKFPGGKFKTAIYLETDAAFILIALVKDFAIVIKSSVLAECCEDSLVL